MDAEIRLEGERAVTDLEFWTREFERSSRKLREAKERLAEHQAFRHGISEGSRVRVLKENKQPPCEAIVIGWSLRIHEHSASSKPYLKVQFVADDGTVSDRIVKVSAWEPL